MDTATISVAHQQYAIVSDGVVSLYEGDGSTMTTPSRGYLTVTPSTEYGQVEVSIDVVMRELDDYVPQGWTLEGHGSFQAVAGLRVETTDGQVWKQFTSLGGIQFPSDVLYRAYRQYSSDGSIERHRLELTPRFIVPTHEVDEGDLADEIGDDGPSVLGLHVFTED
ncbi:hypothetical protein HQ325_16920 [Rhodococcus sp. BP-349]|uniref:hypothetical protein n=1 Tax=unclassified Rhodococcus (in: high G+C Gram-positive bacteria) TaxID=192944 RepID=UPI001C9B85E9|nr:MULTISPECIES: hypothetical protein [unclassified Rhodococcus (in: high G+C Gram-positive bacteria)]MBY6540359.1 hypothetical protein [Rhodococcus sp. BP-363]MBY6545616.1 hypothetical protein [Rhodococcus sp. BP-369]MBY6564846.1 hypothetical protein [Rhodococcus sp. BP-370]MBY6578218.1 hypothetical protein [Rhodococcus sp. BP-364]MBY6587519.1 hypothetical protein [Rhodococcus sp. BP-358]